MDNELLQTWQDHLDSKAEFERLPVRVRCTAGNERNLLTLAGEKIGADELDRAPLGQVWVFRN